MVGSTTLQLYPECPLNLAPRAVADSISFLLRCASSSPSTLRSQHLQLAGPMFLCPVGHHLFRKLLSIGMDMPHVLTILRTAGLKSFWRKGKDRKRTENERDRNTRDTPRKQPYVPNRCNKVHCAISETRFAHKICQSHVRLLLASGICFPNSLLTLVCFGSWFAHDTEPMLIYYTNSQYS